MPVSVPLKVHGSGGICVLIRLQDVAAKAIQQLCQGSYYTLLIWALDQQACQLGLGYNMWSEFSFSACRWAIPYGHPDQPMPISATAYEVLE